VPREFARLQHTLLGPGQFALDQLIDAGLWVEREELPQVRLDLARAQEVDAGEQHAVRVQQRLHARRLLLREQAPLRLEEAAVVVAVMARHAAASELLELGVLGEVTTTSGEWSCSST
jgi:hypothetical protein